MCGPLLEARQLQHTVDILEGVLYVDRFLAVWDMVWSGVRVINTVMCEGLSTDE